MFNKQVTDNEKDIIIKNMGNNINRLYEKNKRCMNLIKEIQEVIEPYQNEIEKDIIKLPIAIENILEIKENRIKELKEEIDYLKTELAGVDI